MIHYHHQYCDHHPDYHHGRHSHYRYRHHHRDDIITVIYMCDLLLLHPEKSRIGMAVFTLRVLHLCRLFRAGPDVTNPTTPLQYRDVFVLYDGSYVTSPANFVRGLQAEGVPACELEGIDRVGGRVGGGTRVGSRVSDVVAVDRAGWESQVGEVAVSRTDRVTVAEWKCVQGLERRVVVWVTDWREDNWPGGDLYHMLFGMTRCTTQLVIVYPP